MGKSSCSFLVHRSNTTCQYISGYRVLDTRAITFIYSSASSSCLTSSSSSSFCNSLLLLGDFSRLRSSLIMGQVWGCIQDRCSGKEWKQAQLKKITDKVFDRFRDESGKVHMTFEELYIAVLLVFNDLNKNLPGPHIDPPTKVEFRGMMETFDLNLDGELDHEEFEAFIQKLTGDTLTLISQNLIIALVAAPTIALMTKRATEGVPGVGKVVQRLPSSVYASLVTLVVMMIQTASENVN